MRLPLVPPLALLLTAAMASVPLPAQVSFSVGIHLPGVDIGINQPTYPELVPVPGYPVYYAPGSPNNFFFYDGRYWVLQGDFWYSSTWYNGPWDRCAPDLVPGYLLRVPVGYYRHPPRWFGPWRRDEVPHWGDRWGRGWERRRAGWDRPGPAYRPAPLPTYQREYAGPRYPRPDEQRQIHEQHYDYQPRERFQPGDRGRGHQEFRGGPQGPGRKRHFEGD